MHDNDDNDYDDNDINWWKARTRCRFRTDHHNSYPVLTLSIQNALQEKNNFNDVTLNQKSFFYTQHRIKIISDKNTTYIFSILTTSVILTLWIISSEWIGFDFTDYLYSLQLISLHNKVIKNMQGEQNTHSKAQTTRDAHGRTHTFTINKGTNC